MARRKVEESVLKWKKKTWFEVLSPEIFNQKVIGEIVGSSQEDLVGRRLKVNLREITGSIKSQNFNTYLKVVKASSSQAITEITGYEIMPNVIKRYVKKNREKIEDSFIIKTKDDIYLRIKPMVVTKSKASRLIRTEIRLTLKELVYQGANNKTYEQISQEIINNRFAIELQKKLSNIFPLAQTLISKYKIVDNLREVRKEKINNEINDFLSLRKNRVKRVKVVKEKQQEETKEE